MTSESRFLAPLISVVIPTYNRGDDVVKAVESLSRQTHQNLEIIVVVDGSADGTAGKLKKLQETEPRLRIIEQKNQGVSVARNRGIDEARGQYIALLDDDDRVSPRRLALQLRELQRAPQGVPTLCTANMDFLNKDGTRQAQKYPAAITADTIYANNTFIPPTSWFASKETFRDVGGFDTSMRSAEDFDWLLRLAKMGGNFVCAKGTGGEPLVTYLMPEKGKIYSGHAESIQRLLDNHGDVLHERAVHHLQGEIARANHSLVEKAPSPKKPPGPLRPARSARNLKI